MPKNAAETVAPRSRLTWDVYPDHVEYTTVNGQRRRIDLPVYEADVNGAKIVFNAGKSRIRFAREHVCWPVVAVAARRLDAADSVQEMLHTMTCFSDSILADAAALRGHANTRADKMRLADAKDTVACARVNADLLLTYMRFTRERPETIPAVASGLAKAADAIASVGVAKTDAAHIAKVAAWLAEQRPETIPAVVEDDEPQSFLTPEEFFALLPDAITPEEFLAMIDAA